MPTTGLITTRSGLGRTVRRLAINRHGRNSFVERCPKGACVLDVGCGNDSPRLFKELRPDIYYVGIDVGDCRQSHDPQLDADEYLIAQSNDFPDSVARLGCRFHAVVSSHNLEHCEDREGIVRAMARALVPGGYLYMAFPSAASIHFPSRGGCLNFFDDPTHRVVPDFAATCAALREEGLTIKYAAPRYRPPLKLLQGLLIEPISSRSKRVMGGTWALYGFESVIWAQRAP